MNYRDRWTVWGYSSRRGLRPFWINYQTEPIGLKKARVKLNPCFKIDSFQLLVSNNLRVHINHPLIKRVLLLTSDNFQGNLFIHIHNKDKNKNWVEKLRAKLSKSAIMKDKLIHWKDRFKTADNQNMNAKTAKDCKEKYLTWNLV